MDLNMSEFYEVHPEFLLHFVHGLSGYIPCKLYAGDMPTFALDHANTVNL
jgi:hypothetical protein